MSMDLEPQTYIYKKKKVLFAHFSCFYWKKISEHMKNLFLSSKLSEIRKYFIK